MSSYIQKEAHGPAPNMPPAVMHAATPPPKVTGKYVVVFCFGFEGPEPENVFQQWYSAAKPDRALFAEVGQLVFCLQSSAQERLRLLTPLQTAFLLPAHRSSGALLPISQDIRYFSPISSCGHQPELCCSTPDFG